jgi:hypothetical protein
MADAAQWVLGTAATVREALPRKREACMWLIGVVILLVVGAALTVALGWTPRATPGPPLWDIAQLGAASATSFGGFAGFSLASAIFVAGLDAARTSPVFATVFGMMLVGFLDLVIASWIAGSAPSASQPDDASAMSLELALGNLCGNLGIAVTWLALAPLTTVIGLPALAAALVWPLLFMGLAAGGWAGLIAYRVTLARTMACLAIPILGVALPAVYRLVAVPRWPALWPTSEAALQFAFVALGTAAVMLVLHFGLLVAYGRKEAQESLHTVGHRLMLVVGQIYALVVGLLWFAVAAP